jgi:hypothetical protein
LCKEIVENTKALVEKVCCTLSGKNFAIDLYGSESFLSQQLFNKDGDDLMELLKDDQLNKMMDNFFPLYSPNIPNVITLFKHCPINRGYIDNILLFKFKKHYEYIQDSCFLRQMSNQKVLLFQIFVNNCVFGVDLAKCMKFGSDL